MDGTTLSVQDTPENEEHFGRSKSGRGDSAYPKARLVALNVPRTHTLAAVAIGPYRASELGLARELWSRVSDHSVIIVDRGFLAYGTLYSLHASGEERHWLTRAKKNLRWRVVKPLGPGDDLIEVEISAKARKDDPTLPKTMAARAIRYQRRGFQPQTLLTSMLDPQAFPAAAVAELYHERWEIELGFDETKTHMLEREECLRSKKPTGVLQELWGIAIAYNVVRLVMAQVARDAGVPPRRISFRNALLLVRSTALWACHEAPGNLPRHFRRAKEDIARFILPERRPRSNPRQVKVKMSNYGKKPLRGSLTSAQKSAEGQA
jgi:hypothetical protein